MSEEKPKKMAIIVSKSTLDMAYPPFILAQVGASLGMEVHLFFTFWGINIIKKGGAKKLKLPGLMRIGTGMMKKKMKQAGVPSLEEMIKTCHELGVKLWACSQTMEIMGIKREDLIDEVEDVVGATAFLDIAQDADITLFI
ncbi:MAG: DsrE/DsrF/DrsH-like family protein [Candidatus Asgardarchaeia archaeon]